MLTSPQKTTLKTAILADSTANAFPNTSDGNYDLASYLNTVPGTPSLIWRNDVTPDEVSAVTDMTEFVALSAIKQNGLLLMTQGTKIDATRLSVRNAFSAIFAAGNTLTALTALAQKAATRFEAIFTTAQVSSMLGRSVTGQEVQDARNS